MLALVRRGSKKGKLVEVSQWCNDWFMVADDPLPYAPTKLAFTAKDFHIISTHKNNGVLFHLYQLTFVKDEKSEYFCSFRRRRQLSPVDTASSIKK